MTCTFPTHRWLLRLRPTEESRQGGHGGGKNRDAWLFWGVFSLPRGGVLLIFRLGGAFQVAFDAPYVSCSGGTDQQAGNPELASHRQLASREWMLEAAHGGFDSRP